jgi:hypothetical protein
MEDNRRQNGQNSSSPQGGEFRHSQSSGSLPGFDGMNYEEQRGQYQMNDQPGSSSQEPSGQSAPAIGNE